VEGTRTVGVNAEKQKVVISGIVRPQDIGPDNTISSVYLANASVQVDGKGPIGDRQRKGLISTILHWLF
jgi:flagellar L-ring protein precursor FlgH